MFVIPFYFNDYFAFNKFSIVLSRCYLLNTNIFLFGYFGVGKTFFSKGFLGEVLNYNYDVNSSSFSKVNVFFLNNTYFYHFDCYDSLSSRNIDFKILCEENFFSLVEWGDKLMSKISPDLLIYIYFYSFYSRVVILKSYNINFLKLFL
jgi:tRNA A37 threonylcarbamoyladenosine biosynthesis protein TsaE